MIPPPESAQKDPFFFPLGIKLALALLCVALIMVAFLFGYFGPEARQSFEERSDRLIMMSGEAFRDMVGKNTQESMDLLTNLIHYTTDSRRRMMADLPLSLYQNDVNRIRRAIEEADDQKSLRFQDNVKILSHEMERRALTEVDHRLSRLTEEQTALGVDFAAD
ncbi:MAG: hypothetical protein KJ645_01210, partial [Planctomycetes bacterium]|nr:hypothetical protein [Planctomycetota bacterium]